MPLLVCLTVEEYLFKAKIMGRKAMVSLNSVLLTQWAGEFLSAGERNAGGF